MSRAFVDDSASDHPSSKVDFTVQSRSEIEPTGETAGEPEATPDTKSHAHLTAEVERLLSDRATVSAWMREPDYVEIVTLEWLTAWLNRRPLKASS